MTAAPILVGTDFSEPSECAVIAALDLARKSGAAVCIAHVFSAFPGGERKAECEADLEAAMQRQLDACRSRLDRLEEREAAWGGTVSFRTLEGRPPLALAELARSLGAALIAVGSHGRSRFSRLLLGSVSERLVRIAETSVLIARPEGERTGGFSRILVGTDFSPRSFKALNQALGLAARGASVEILHAWQIPMADSGFYGPLADDEAERRRLRADAERRGRAMIGGVDPLDATVTFREVEDAPIRAIQHRLQAGDYDLVVVGSHGEVDELPAWLIGSVAEATARYSPCSVLVAR